MLSDPRSLQAARLAVSIPPGKFVNSKPLVPLVIRFGPIGDMVLQTPLFHLLHGRYGRPCRLLTAGPASAALFADNPDVEEIWSLRKRHAPFLLSPERWRLAFWLRMHRGPVYVSEDSRRQLRNLRRLFAITGTSSDCCLFIDQFPPFSDEHSVDQLLRFGQATPLAFQSGFSAQTADPQAAPRLYVRPGDREDREAWLRQRGFAGHPLVLLQPGNKQAIKWRHARVEDPKAWPVARWAALLQAMHAQLPDARLLLCGSPAERNLLQEIHAAAAIGRIEIASDDLPLRRLLAVLETAHSMVSVDSGPAHIAAAIGCPLVVLYGQASPKRWGRRSPVNAPVIELGGAPLHRTASEIPLDAVVEAWLHLHTTSTNSGHADVTQR